MRWRISMRGNNNQCKMTRRTPNSLFNVCAYMRWYLTRIIKFCAIHIENVNLLLKRFAILYYTIARFILKASPPHSISIARFFVYIVFVHLTKNDILFSTTWHFMLNYHFKLVLNMEICILYLHPRAMNKRWRETDRQNNCWVLCKSLIFLVVAFQFY